jgi:hypothetical protein
MAFAVLMAVAAIAPSPALLVGASGADCDVPAGDGGWRETGLGEEDATIREAVPHSSLKRCG